MNNADYIKDFKETSYEWYAPKWEEYRKVHCWRNYISEDLIEIWDSFSDIQKYHIYKNADSLASDEHWD